MKHMKLIWFASAMAAVLLISVESVHADVAIVGGKALAIESTLPDVSDLWVTPQDFTLISGFELKPEGACCDAICIPIKQDADSDLFVKRDGRSWINVTEFANRIQQAHVADYESGVWSFGQVPHTRKSFLESATAPDFALQDRDGNIVKLSDFRGKKVLIITWASW